MVCGSKIQDDDDDDYFAVLGLELRAFTFSPSTLS
jgi:hypothetical protein